MNKYHYDITLMENGIHVKKWLDLTNDSEHLAMCLMVNTKLLKLLLVK
jgi:hypothetical protein